MKRVGSRPPGYYFFRDYNLILCTTLRAASSSMSKAVHGKAGMDQEKVLRVRDNIPVVTWFREPYDRLASVYRVFKQGDSFGEFVDMVLSSYNRHWVPQTQVHTFEHVFLPNKIIRFDDLQKSWPDHFPDYPLPHLKAFKRHSWDTLKNDLKISQLAALNEYYKDDIELYRKLNVYV